jgi:hypothetical protein
MTKDKMFLFFYFLKVLIVRNHPYFNRYSFDYDFALLQLSKLITFDGVTKAPITLPSATDIISDGASVLVSGWGWTRNVNETNLRLRGVIIPVINQAKCNQIYAFDGGITKQMVCAGSLGKDSCNVR